MTELEKKLLADAIIIAGDSAKSCTGVLKALKAEDCGNISDEFNSRIQYTIQKYLEPFVSEDKLVRIMEEEIAPQLAVSNYINIIITIERYDGTLPIGML